MTLATVLSALDFNVSGWNLSYLSGASLPSPTTIPGSVSDPNSDQGKIKAYITTLYNSSSTAASALDAIVTANGAIRIGGLPTGSGPEPGYYQDAPPSSGDSFIVLSLSDMASIWYVTQDGRFIKETPENTISHELGHAYIERGSLTNLSTDPASGYGGGNASFDFLGPAALFANNVLTDRNLSADKIASYRSSLWDTDTRLSQDIAAYGSLSGGYSASFTGGNHVDIALLGNGNPSAPNDVIDLSNRTDNQPVLAFGFSGNDSISTTGGDDDLYGGAGADTLKGGAGADFLSGEGDNDSIVGGADVDTILGGAGADTLAGEGGSDSIDAGAGDDLVVIGDGVDTVDGGADNDTLAFTGLTGGVSFTIGATSIAGHALQNFEKYEGTTFADTMVGSASADTLGGGAGDDSISGGASDSGADSLTGADGADTIAGGAGADTLSGGAGADQLAGGDGNDSLSDLGGGSTWREPDDNIAPRDILRGGGGADTIVTTSEGAVLEGGAGDDVLNAVGVEAWDAIVKFGAGDGHDTLAFETFTATGGSYGPVDYSYTHVSTIDFGTLEASDLEVHFSDWRVIHAYGTPATNYWITGTVSIVVKSTGDEIVLGYTDADLDNLDNVYEDGDLIWDNDLSYGIYNGVVDGLLDKIAHDGGFILE